MDHCNSAPVWRERQVDFLLNAVPGVRRLGQANGPGTDLLMGNGTVVESVRPGKVFRARPEAMASAHLPLTLPRFAKLVGILLEDVCASDRPIANDSRPHVE